MLLSAAPVQASGVPDDVAAFVARLDRCDYMRGEDSEEPARRAEIDRALISNCRGTDAELARLRRRHARDPANIDRLSRYDPDIKGRPPAR